MTEARTRAEGGMETSYGFRQVADGEKQGLVNDVFHKVAKRRFDDISSVAVAFALDVVDGTVARARIGLGGVAATPIRALRTEASLEGAPWTRESVAAAASVLAAEGTPLSDHRASDRYRSAMLGQSLLRLHTEQRTTEQGAS